MIRKLFEKFEEACYDLDGLECWSGRECQEILSYSDWRNFINTIQKAIKSCENSGEKESDHFVGVTKMVEIGKGGQKIEFAYFGKEASNYRIIIFGHGCQGEYKYTGESYAGDVRYVKGIPCKAEEHHFGGIVVEVV